VWHELHAAVEALRHPWRRGDSWEALLLGLHHGHDHGVHPHHRRSVVAHGRRLLRLLRQQEGCRGHSGIVHGASWLLHPGGWRLPDGRRSWCAGCG
jgi:hypothetical protein